MLPEYNKRVSRAFQTETFIVSFTRFLVVLYREIRGENYCRNTIVEFINNAEIHKCDRAHERITMDVIIEKQLFVVALVRATNSYNRVSFKKNKPSKYTTDDDDQVFFFVYTRQITFVNIPFISVTVILRSK